MQNQNYAVCTKTCYEDKVYWCVQKRQNLNKTFMQNQNHALQKIIFLLRMLVLFSRTNIYTFLHQDAFI